MRVILFVFISISFQSFADQEGQKIKLKNIKAYAVGAENQTPEQVKQRAINEAKLLALQQASVTEQITTYSDFMIKETENQIEEIFNSNILNDMQGQFKILSCFLKKRKLTIEGFLKFILWPT